MSRKIDLTKPLSDEDRQYLEDRARHHDIATADANAGYEDDGSGPLTSPVGVSGVSVGGSSPLQQDPTAARFATPGPAVQAGDGLKTEEGYQSMKVAELQDEIDRRNETRDEDEQIPRSGTKQDLIDRLTADDQSE
jgi:hypothetical protein